MYYPWVLNPSSPAAAAATGDNGVGVAGMNWKCRILPLKILNSANSGQYSWWAAAFVYAADHGAHGDFGARAPRCCSMVRAARLWCWPGYSRCFQSKPRHSQYPSRLRRATPTTSADRPVTVISTL